LDSDAEVAEIDYTAFTSRRTAEHVTAWLIVRRVKRLQPTTKVSERGAVRHLPLPRCVHRLTHPPRSQINDRKASVFRRWIQAQKADIVRVRRDSGR